MLRWSLLSPQTAHIRACLHLGKMQFEFQDTPNNKEEEGPPSAEELADMRKDADRQANPVELPCKLSSEGDSESWNLGKANYLRLFDVFRTSHTAYLAAYPTGFQDLPEWVVSRRELYENFATYLLEVYIIAPGNKNAGQPLACSTVCNGLGALLNMVKVRFGGSGSIETKLFLTCLELRANTPSSKWLMGLKTNLQRRSFKRAMAAGKKMDTSASKLLSLLHLAISLAHICVAC